LTAVQIDAVKFNNRLFLLVSLVTLLMLLAHPFHILIAIRGVNYTLFQDFSILLGLLIGCVFHALMVLIFFLFFNFFRKNFESVLRIKNFSLSMALGMCFFALSLPLFAIALSLQTQMGISILLILRIALIYGAVIAHCILLEASLRDVISESAKSFLKICLILMSICFVLSTVVTMMAIGDFHALDSSLGAAIGLASAEFWMLPFMIPYSAFLVIALFNFPKRLAAQEQRKREQPQDVDVSPAVSDSPMFVSVRKSVREKFEERRW